ncbi:putative Nudix hydrolase NudL [Jeotgalibaca dankookensis]|uniref:Putative Nudix hydrolase NudL n=1 Tax=Jeotgalibaca dankookensis TaxID=708126 RepID=A0A1S6IQ26_9LACT|nr:CoA pyrophosphatase [Jeotgalibaca dankookensis]AQS53570.1 putative Nudix hydrolase NudL [Jeotgalibaca dankookensis]
MIEEIENMLADYQPSPLGNQRLYSVMLPLIQREGEWHILFERRSQKISQPGQTSFPGGAVEMGESFKQAAIRETMEELNLSRNQIELLGEIDYIVSEERLIHCFVCKLTAPFETIHYDEAEVAAIFTIPLQYFIKNRPTYYTSRFVLEHDDDFPYDLVPTGKGYRFNGGKHRIPFYRINGYSLWGYTANLTDHFIDLLTSRKIKPF